MYISLTLIFKNMYKYYNSTEAVEEDIMLVIRICLLDRYCSEINEGRRECFMFKEISENNLKDSISKCTSSMNMRRRLADSVMMLS